VKVYERHLAREIYGDTLLVLTAFLALFGFFDLIHELESVGKGGYEIHHALGFVALTLPGRAYEILPIAVLIGTLYALTLLARHSEITVFRASGLATSELLVTLAVVAILAVFPAFTDRITLSKLPGLSPWKTIRPSIPLSAPFFCSTGRAPTRPSAHHWN